MPPERSTSKDVRCAPTSPCGRWSAPRSSREREQMSESSSTGAETMPDVETAFDEIEVEQPLVGIIMGSANDKDKMKAAGKALGEAGILYEVRVMSAHRTPD